jgi:hypothetical protein
MAAMFHGFFDESGKAHQHQVVVFSGFVTTWKWWVQLEEEWERLLRQFSLNAVHFSKLRKRTSVLKHFIAVMRRHIEFGISVAIKVDDFRSLPEAMQKALGGDPHYLAFKMVVIAMVNRVLTEEGSSLSFTQDEDEQTTAHCFDWYKDIKRQMPGFAAKLASFAVADDHFFPQLQAADVFAALSRADAESQLLGLENEYGELFAEFRKREETARLFTMSHIVTPANLAVAAKDWNEGMRSSGLLRSEDDETQG